MHPILKERLHRPRTVFAPGARIRMNIVPMFLNLFIPWGVFLCTCGLTSFWVMWSEPGFAATAIMLVFVIWLLLMYVAVFARQRVAEPTWFTYVAVTFGAAALSGVICGVSNYRSYSRRFYEIQDLKVIHQMDASRERGQNLMDAGIIHFAHGNKLDQTRSWHFKHHQLYCVAPIVGSSGEPFTRSYDFWAVGEDCCAATSSDFRCGEDWRSTTARSGIRVLDPDTLMYYRLAVQQAETLYGIVASAPVFVTWSKDPLAEVNGWSEQAFKNYVFMVGLAFVVSLLCLTAATFRFAWLGRARSAYSMDFYDDPEWKHQNEGGAKAERERAPAMGYGTRSYAAAA